MSSREPPGIRTLYQAVSSVLLMYLSTNRRRIPCHAVSRLAGTDTIPPLSSGGGAPVVQQIRGHLWRANHAALSTCINWTATPTRRATDVRTALTFCNRSLLPFGKPMWRVGDTNCLDDDHLLRRGPFRHTFLMQWFLRHRGWQCSRVQAVHLSIAKSPRDYRRRTTTATRSI